MPPLKAAQPRRIIFDPWNTASKGHQHAENRLGGSTSWRDSRTVKLNAQFQHKTSDGDGGGGPRISDTVGAGSEDFGSNGRTDNGWNDSVQGWRGRQGIAGERWGDVGTMMSGKRQKISKEQEQEQEEEEQGIPTSAQPLKPDEDNDEDAVDQNDKDTAPLKAPTKITRPAQIFQSLTILINGSTYPTISDHKLKSLLTSHGARLSISHARRQVTHVILGRANSAGNHQATHKDMDKDMDKDKDKDKGAGGGLAGGKRQREILKKSTGGLGKGVRYVTVDWYVLSFTLCPFLIVL